MFVCIQDFIVHDTETKLGHKCHKNIDDTFNPVRPEHILLDLFISSVVAGGVGGGLEVYCPGPPLLVPEVRLTTAVGVLQGTAPGE